MYVIDRYDISLVKAILLRFVFFVYRPSADVDTLHLLLITRNHHTETKCRDSRL